MRTILHCYHHDGLGNVCPLRRHLMKNGEGRVLGVRSTEIKELRAPRKGIKRQNLLMRFLILALFLSAPGLLLAIEHSGTVRAADQFIPGATVTARQGGAKIVTYTDQGGRYYLDLTPGVWEIEISMFGFKTQTTPVTIKDQATSHDWTLEMPRPGEPVETAKPAAGEAKKPDAPPAAAPAAP